MIRFFYIRCVAVRHCMWDLPLLFRHPRLRWWGGLRWGDIFWEERKKGQP